MLDRDYFDLAVARLKLGVALLQYGWRFGITGREGGDDAGLGAGARVSGVLLLYALDGGP